MRLIIDNKSKQEIFVAIFQILKNWSSHINMHFEKDKLYIQAMDKSHICLADISVMSGWFSTYECINNANICVDSGQFAILINYALKHTTLEMLFDIDINEDKLYINFLNGQGQCQGQDKKTGAFDHFFELSLMDMDETELGVPTVEYDVDFNIDCKKWVEVLSELNTIGQDLNIQCKENTIELNATGDATKLKVNIPVDDLNEYAIAEGEELNISYSLGHLCKMCCSTKLGSSVEVSLSNEYPMSLKYNLGDNSRVIFYIAPKISD